jgi:predicted DNA-binding protein with PD1-like motif
MRHKLLEQIDGNRKFVLVLDAGEEAVASIQAFARQQNLQGSTVLGIGAFETCAFGHFNSATKEFTRNDVTVQSEVLALNGNIAGGLGDNDGHEDDDGHDHGHDHGAAEDDGPHLHLHCVVGLNDASTRGGHLIQGIVRPTMELVIEESPVHLSRGLDRASGLVLLQPNQKD